MIFGRRALVTFVLAVAMSVPAVAQDGKTVPVQNPYTYGNAWFVNNVKFVDNANQELDALGQLDLRHEAVADAKSARC